MSKYDALVELLARRAAIVTLTFDEIAERVPGGLPPSAYVHRPWWANELRGSHVQARSWLSAGWWVESVDLDGRRVTFVRDTPS